MGIPAIATQQQMLMHDYRKKFILFSISSTCSKISIVVPWCQFPNTSSSQDMLETRSVQDGHLLFVICYEDSSQWEFVICNLIEDQPRGICNLWFVICFSRNHLVSSRKTRREEDSSILSRSSQEEAIQMTPIHPEGSEFSQNPQEFRKRGAVSPFVKVEFRCTENQNK